MIDRTADRIVLPLEPTGVSRRSFLRAAGYGVTAATLVACSRAPVRSILSATAGSSVVVPGRPYFIATTCGGCDAACGMLAKCVDGRPVKLEGLPGHPVSGGALCAAGQAQVLSLYDSHRLDGPRLVASRGSSAAESAAVGWEAADARVRERLAAAKGRVLLLTGAVTSPSTLAWIGRFAESCGARHVSWGDECAAAIADAMAATHGRRGVPAYRFGPARVIASFGADFLGTWLSPVEFTREWAARRSGLVESARVGSHWQIESRVSLTGLRADRRIRIAPWELPAVVNALGSALGVPDAASASAPAEHASWIAELAAALGAARGESLVVCDDADPSVQATVLAINERLGNIGKTLDLEACSPAPGGAAAIAAALASMRDGAVDVLVVAGCNPGHAFPGATDGFAASAARVGTVVALAPMDDETTVAADVVVPETHALAAWDDAQPRAGIVSLRQPVIVPLRHARTLRECLAAWCGDSRPDRVLVRSHWAAETSAGRTPFRGDFDAAFDRALEAGHFRIEPKSMRAAAALSPSAARSAPAAGSFVLLTYEKVAVRDGRDAHNAWLQELPDPVTKCVWDNYAGLSPATADALGIATGDVVRLTGPSGSAELPALVQRGQHDGVVTVARGYGRAGTGRFANAGPDWLEARPTVDPSGTVGTNAARIGRDGAAVRVERTGSRRPLACTQDHHSLTVPPHLAPAHGEVRDAVRTLTPEELGAAGRGEGVSKDAHGSGQGAGQGGSHGGAGLWPADHATKGPRWGMAVDLAACTGCSACVVACQSENNVPVVGRDEVLRHREMHWIRIDRYYDGPDESLAASQQPMMCQHCANAPCETVCPVLATVHSEDGVNQQVYNRCVGTRYCANNCPYKVRRFNWFDYPHDDALENLSLNPDVTVRTRGVMEKCSLCAQRIQAWKDDRGGAPSAPGGSAPVTACQQSCPAGAIVFGDLNDPKSRISQLLVEGRAYQVLGELNVQPAVSYLADIRRRSRGEAHR